MPGATPTRSVLVFEKPLVRYRNDAYANVINARCARIGSTEFHGFDLHSGKSNGDDLRGSGDRKLVFRIVDHMQLAFQDVDKPKDTRHVRPENRGEDFQLQSR